MMHIIQMKPSGNLLFVEDGETVLQAAMRSGYEFPFSCGSATCGTCMGKVCDGNFTYDGVEPYALDIDARENGFALFCSVKPTSDMVIDIEDVYAPHFFPARKAEYQVSDFSILKDNVYQVFLMPKKKALKYHAGQYLKIVCNDGVPLPFSIAGMYQGDGRVELQIKDIDDNPYTTEIVNKIKAREDLLLRGPYGTVRYYPELTLPILFMAGGTGIVPIKALIEKAMHTNPEQSLHLYWGGSKVEDLYLLETFAELAEKNKSFNFTPVLSKAAAGWDGAVGNLADYIALQYQDMASFQVYISGATELVYAGLDAFTAKGVKPKLVFSDTFEYFPRVS
jgi:CDP-4-dehydro-6-deoxyglucose reductase